MRKQLMVLTALAVVLSTPAFAQRINASLRGTITDSSGGTGPYVLPLTGPKP